MPRVSVIVPMYNVEDFIGECVASLHAQSLKDFEAVCVNDGSTDATFERARAAAEDDPRFVFVERENGGLSAARNSGLDVATGDYVCFLDADDWYVPATLESLTDMAAGGNLDVLDFSARTVYENETARRLHQEDYGFRTEIRGVWEGPALFAHYWQMREYVSSACFHLVRRSMIEENGLRFGEGLLHEDELFTPLVYAYAKRAAFLNEPYYCRRMREDSIMTRPRTMRNVHSLLRISQLLHAWAIEHAESYPPEFIDALAQDIAYIRDAAFMALQEAGQEAAAAYADTLDPQQRLDFDLTVRYVSDQAHERCRALEESRTYKVGSLMVAAPRALRDLRDQVVMKKK